MKQSKSLHFLLIVLTTLSLTSFALAADYSDAVKVNEEFIAAMESYIQKLENAQNGTSVAAAFNDYADTIEKLAPEMKAIAAKYPELRNSEEIPAALQPLTEKAEQLAGRMAGSMMKVFPYLSDPAVQEAQNRMAEAMGKMQ